MRITVKQPLPFWVRLTAQGFSGEQVAGTTTTSTEDSHFITRVVNATLADSYVINWELLHPEDGASYTTVFSSGDESIATVDSGGTLTVLSNGEVTITATTTQSTDGAIAVTSIPVSVSVSAGQSLDTIENVAGSLGAAFDSSIEALLSGKDPSGSKPRFSSRDLATKTFTRNEDFWGVGLNGLSAISPNNSRGNNTRAGTAITKRHIICAAHYPLSVGDTVDFVADIAGSSVAVTRTIVQAKTQQLYAGQSGGYCYELQVCLLDSDLPAEVDVMKVMPSDAANYSGQYNWMGTSSCAFDQEQKAVSRMLFVLSDGVYFGEKLSEHFFNALSGGSLLNGASVAPSVYGYSSTSDFVSTPKLLETDDVYTFNEVIITGDSGAPNCLVLNGDLILVGLNTTSTAGNYIANRISDVNQLIIDVDALESISTGYTVTEADFSAYPTYS